MSQSSPQRSSSSNATERITSGVPGLDPLIGGGFPQGKVILVLGEPGTGKTILSSQYLYSGASQRGEKGVYVGMNEPKPRFAEK